MAGMIVIAALVSGVAYSMGNSYQPTIAQTGNATTTTGVGQFPCAPAQTGGGGGQNRVLLQQLRVTRLVLTWIPLVPQMKEINSQAS
jgi:hypothetical protein